MTMHPAELNEINPCRSCAERCVGCHSVCDRRREWLAKWAECQDSEYKQRAADRADPHLEDQRLHKIKLSKEKRQ